MAWLTGSPAAFELLDFPSRPARGGAADRGRRRAVIAGLSAALMFLCAQRGYALHGADVALYGDEGAWSNGLVAITNMLNYLHLSHEKLMAADLYYETQDLSTLYKVIVFPGGWAGYYNWDIAYNGKERIRRFVRLGGGYLGICAGAYFACDKVFSQGTNYDEYYNLDLFPGTGTGPLNDIADWDTVGYNMCWFRFTNNAEALGGYRAVSNRECILYYGGPYFTINTGAQVDVLATYDYSGSSSGKAAVVAFRYGAGHVILMGPHPEIEEDSTRDGISTNDMPRKNTMNDHGSDWDLMGHLFNWLMPSPAAQFRMIQPPATGQVRLAWTAAPRRPFTLCSSSNLVAWTCRATVFSNAPLHELQLPAPGQACQFYRVSRALEEMAYIPAGPFQMGDALNDGFKNERPVHTNTLDAFYIDRYEIANEPMRQVMQWAYDRGLVVVGRNAVSNRYGSVQQLLPLSGPAGLAFADGTFTVFSGREYHPCVLVTWYGAQAFANFRSLMEGLTPCINFTNWTCNWPNNGYRLPTEAEWEKAARGGLTGLRYAWGNTIGGSNANYYGSGDVFEGVDVQTTPVGSYDGLQYPQPAGDMANGYGLYDMVGNVWEWCWDWFSATNYTTLPATNPVGPATGVYRVLRGGSWYNAPGSTPNYLRCSVRLDGYTPDASYPTFGFRTVRRAD